MRSSDVIRVIDSHTEGEPTRVVLEGGPDLGTGPLSERVKRFARDHDGFRRTATLEPRGSDALVGALLCPPHEPSCDTGVIFFNNSGYLGMCGHASIGLAVTLAHMNRVQPGPLRFDTPVGVVDIMLGEHNEVTITNVPSYRYLRNVTLTVTGIGTLTGDVAWGGNWFFLVRNSPVAVAADRITELRDAALRVRRALTVSGVTGPAGEEIDHIEFFGPGENGAHSRNFVLCPGGAYDRSPCGTGTSAKLACLAADGALQPGETWIQESVIGSRFAASYQTGKGDTVIASITGRAYICSEATLLVQPGDPFAEGFLTL